MGLDEELRECEVSPEEIAGYGSLIVGGRPFMSLQKYPVRVWALGGKPGHFPVGLLDVAKVLGKDKELLELAGDELELNDAAK